MSYSSIADWENRLDTRVLAQLASDTGSPVSPIIGNAVLQAALDGAAGEINMAILVGQRYTVAELNGLSGVDQQVLFDLNCWLATARLRMRRGLPLDDYYQIKEAQKLLQLLREGQRVFNSLPQEEAGVPADNFPSIQFYSNLNLLRDRTTVGFFTPRRVQSNH